MLISRIWSVATGGNKRNSPIYAILRPFEKKTVYVRGVQHKLVFRRLLAPGPRTSLESRLARLQFSAQLELQKQDTKSMSYHRGQCRALLLPLHFL